LDIDNANSGAYFAGADTGPGDGGRSYKAARLPLQVLIRK
jgi:hypothetical protein